MNNHSNVATPTLANCVNGLNEFIYIHFIHEAPTPHNNYLLDNLANHPNVVLYRHYIFSPSTVPGRPWKTMGSGDVQASHIHHGYNKIFDWRLFKLALLDKESVFFVVGWESPSIVLVLFILGLRRRPLIMWDDGPTERSIELIKSVWRPRQAIKRVLIKLINYTPGTYFITGNNKKSGLTQIGILPSKLEKLPFFVRSGIFASELRNKHKCLNESILIVAGGRLIRSKGYDVLMNSLGLLRTRCVSAFKLVLIGSGDDKSILVELANKLSIKSSIDFVDWAEPDLFASYIHSCDIFVAPARFDHFPTTVIAAMQAGVAVIATDGVGSAVEFIESGRNGIIVPSESPEALSSALEQLISNPTLRKVLGTAGKDTISEWPVERGVQLIVDAARKALIQCAE